MNELFLLLLSILLLYFIPLLINKLQYPFHAYYKILFASILIIFVWVIPTISNSWPKIMISILSISGIIKQIQILNATNKNKQ
jgi:hypothetical protein